MFVHWHLEICFILIPLKLFSIGFTLDSAIYTRSFTFGYGNKQIIGDTWLLKDMDGMNYVTVSRDGLCVPLVGHNFLAQPRT